MDEISRRPNGVLPSDDSLLQPANSTEDLGIVPSSVLYMIFRSFVNKVVFKSGLMKSPEAYILSIVYSRSDGR